MCQTPSKTGTLGVTRSKRSTAQAQLTLSLHAGSREAQPKAPLDQGFPGWIVYLTTPPPAQLHQSLFLLSKQSGKALLVNMQSGQKVQGRQDFRLLEA